MKQRLNWIDTLKGFGIILVTFGHLYPHARLETYIYSFHMCLFFFISGFLYSKKDDLKTILKKKTKTVLMPFVVWNLLSSAFSVVLHTNSIDVIIKRFFVIDGEMCWNLPLWFLLVLFITEIVFSLIVSISKSNKSLSFILLSSAILWVLIGEKSITLKLNLVPAALLLYTLGYMFKCNDYNKIIASKYSNIIMAISGITSVVIGGFINGRVSFALDNFENTYLCIIASITGTMFYVFLIIKYVKTKDNNILNYLGKNSLIIMLTQYWVFQIYDLFSIKYNNISVWHYRSTLKAFILTFITLSLILIMNYIIIRISKNNKLKNMFQYLGIRYDS